VNEQRARPAPEATDRAHDVVAHLQAAALEMIAAARALLDVAEELVKEPGEATAMAAALANLAARVVPSGPGGLDGHQQTPGVEHIRVS
jgi:hypothetical protein